MENETMMVATLEVEHQFFDKDQKSHLTQESLMTLQGQMIEVKVHERPLFSHIKKLFMGNGTIVRILHFLIMNTLPHLAQVIRFLGFKVLQFAYNLQLLWVASY
jgi:hypothetical protein